MAQTWAFQSAGTVVTGANPTVPLPATYSTGSLLVIVGINNGGTGGLFSDPSGWTEATINQGSTKISIWYKFATASESSVAISNASSKTKCVMLAYSNIFAIDVIGTVNSATGTALTTTALTTTTSNDLVISVFAITNSGQPLTAGSGYTARVTSNTSPADPSLLIGDENKATAGATTSRSATGAASALWDTFAVSFSQVQTNTGNFFFMFN